MSAGGKLDVSKRESLVDVAAFGLRVRKARKDAGYTQYQLEEITGIYRDVIANIETARRERIDLEQVIVLCNALHIDATQLVPELGPCVPDFEETARLRELLSEIAFKAVSA